MTISEFFKEKYSVRKDKENIYGVGMSDAEFVILLFNICYQKIGMLLAQ